MRAGRYSSPDYDAGPAARAGRQRTMAGSIYERMRNFGIIRIKNQTVEHLFCAGK